jgi:hypothetical protein
MIRRAWLALLCSSCVTACSGSDEPVTYSGTGDAGVRTLDRSGFQDVGLDGRLDYAVGEHWACRPDISPNECERDIDATEVKPDGTFELHEREPAADPAFDCFYVYPTVWVARSAQMTDFSDSGVSLVDDPLLSQAAPFASLCRVYAPLYRQAGLTLTAYPADADKARALQDVRDAFDYYLKHDNRGRKFVLLGHSQGAFLLTSMISRDIDPNPELRAKMISALLLGAQPYAAPGERVGGSFQNIPSCVEPGETGCVIAYNSFAAEAPPTSTSALGHVTTVFANEEIDPSGQVFCTEPAALAGHAGDYYASYFAQRTNNALLGAPMPVAGVDTPFVLYRDLFRGECMQANGSSYLAISADPKPGDTRMLPTYRNSTLEAIGFGTHYMDYNIALDDLLEAVRLQAVAAQ